jgi:hypothetical protein
MCRLTYWDEKLGRETNLKGGEEQVNILKKGGPNVCLDPESAY